MDSATEKLLADLKDQNPHWGRTRLAKESGVHESSVRRWLDRTRRSMPPASGKKKQLLNRLDEQLDEREIAAILRNIKSARPTVRPFKISGDSVKFGIISDSHIGHKMFAEEWLMHAYEFFESEGCEFIYHAGDIVEGMSGRDGQIYELNKLGFEEQVNYAAELIRKSPMPIRAILGNHDQWFKGKGNIGACVGTKLSNECQNFTYLGDDEAYDMLGNIKVMLRHPGDGSAYALSYKTQKFIESLAGGQKPNILINGHYHKGIFFEYRNVHAFEAGTLQGQSKFMRGRNLSSTPSVWCVEAFQDEVGLQRIKSELLRFYE